MDLANEQVIVVSDPFVVAQVLSNRSFDKLENCGYQSSDMVRSLVISASAKDLENRL